ncbi:hypothetical protein CPB85DRAFT_1435741 [Mucidula mucida]|nr:hypothetical protein CPB85DRAFT_1435741 [Mucidula mucida]
MSRGFLVVNVRPAIVKASSRGWLFLRRRSINVGSHISPSLFSSLILVDPVILYAKPPYAARDGNSNTLAVGALGRRWVWRSKDEARSQLLLSPFFQRWHPDVLTAYIEHGMADGNVALKMSPVHETVLFSDTWTGEVELGAPGQTQLRAWLRKANSSNMLIDGTGHVITHEKADALAEEIAMFVHRKYDNKGNCDIVFLASRVDLRSLLEFCS